MTKPWYVEALPAYPKLDISGPPCVNCKHWNPQPKFRHTPSGFVEDGIVLCHSDYRWSDFSCFATRMEPDSK